MDPHEITDLIGRILLGMLFLLAGVDKLGSYTETQAFMETMQVPGALLPGVIIVELFGGLALMVGIMTRWVALGLALFTIIAALLFHTDFSASIQAAMFMKNFAIAGGLMIVFTHGGGAFSIDAWRAGE